MTISPFLVAVCFLLMMALGVYVIYKAISKPPVGGPSEIDAFGSKFVLKGPAWLVMIAVGAIMVALPIIVAMMQKKAMNPSEESAAAKAINAVGDTDPEFEFVSDTTYLDLRSSLVRPWYTYLRGWTHLPGVNGRIRPSRVMHFTVLKTIAASDLVGLRDSTSGDVDIRCLNYVCEKAYIPTPGSVTLGVSVHVESVAVGETFTVLTEETYWNAFSGESGDNFSVTTHSKQVTPEEMSVIIIFPDNKPFGTMDVLEKEPGSSNAHPFQGTSTSMSSQDRKSFYWDHVSPGTGKWTYEMKWTW